MRTTASSFGLAIAISLSSGLGGGPLRAQPSGGQVVAGTAALSSGGGALTITQTSARAIINWEDFSVAAGQSTKFVQPDALSATLNRVISGLPSSLAGTLEANGRVYLINPNGILIGAGARIDTGGFLASTLDVANHEFLAGGDLHFSGSSTAAITNLGAINALGGDVFLIARQVENRGAMSAAGSAGIAAGSEVLLTTGGDQRLFVQATSLPGAIVNSGTIAATTAELKAAGGNAYALAINNSGLVRATGSEVRNGQVWLVASGDSTAINSGTLDASSGTGRGGRVVFTAGRVLLEEGARLNASGSTGGGEVFVGGGWQGADATIPNASAVVMRSGSAIDVSATESGHGGTAVLWSQDYTAFSGEISAKGGPTAGNGGKVETSSHNVLHAVGVVDAGSPTGSAGRWLLDPFDVSIASTAASGTTYAATFTPTADSVILASSIVGTLNGGSNVTITTGTTGTSAGDISVNTPVSWTANNTLTLSAARNVNINANLVATGATAGLVLTPNAAGGLSGSYSLNNNASITLSGLTPSLTIAGTAYTVINSLGVEGDATTTTLQGIKNALGGRFALGSNIDATATSGWNAGAGFTPIGNSGTRFGGTFDGLGHTITGLTISQPSQPNMGMFGYVSTASVLRNIGLVGGSVRGTIGVGHLVGSNDGSIFNSYATGNVSGTKNVGGLVGASLGAIRNAWATGDVSNVAGGIGFVGGLVGNTGSTASTINAWASGSVSGLGPNVGGLVGFVSNGNTSNTYATGNVSGVGIVGGLVGSCFAPLNNSYATGNVTGTSNYVGGLVGYLYSGYTITNTYATGSATGSAGFVGGLVGHNAGTIATSYWNSAATALGVGGGATAGATGKTTAEMKQMATFTGFNIASTGGSGATWRIYEGDTTPWLTVFLKPLTVTVNNATKTYDGAAFSGVGTTNSVASPSPALSGTLAFSGTYQSAVNAGSYSITAAGLYSVQQGYDISHVAGTLTINKANLTLLSGTRSYDGTTAFAASSLTAAGVNGETFAMSGTAVTLGTKNVQTGTVLGSYAGLVVGSSTNGGLAANYNPLSIAVTTSSVGITPAALTASTSDVVKTYDGGTSAMGSPVLLAGSLFSGDTLSGGSFAFVGKDVGSGNKTVTVSGIGVTDGNSGSNYVVTQANNTTSTINRAPLTITAGDATKVYGAALPTFTASYTGLVNNETAAVVTGLQLGTTATAASNVGSYAITPSSGTASNYTLSYTAGSLGVTPAALAIAANNVSKVYGAALPTFTATYSGLVNGDTSAVVTGLAIATPATASSNVGSYAITPSSGTASNYTLSYSPGALAVTPAALTITADNKSRAFGVANPALTATFTGLVNSDTSAVVTGLALATNAILSSPAGNYPITAASATAQNYAITFVDGVLAVGQSQSLLTITADNLSKIYGAALPAFTATYAGLLNGDTSAVVTGLQFSTTATVGSNVGTYAITPFGGSATSYTLAYVPGLLTINPAALSITANSASRVYGATNPVFGASFTGLVNGDTSAVVTGLAFNTPATAASNVGSYAVTPSSGTAPNYTLSYTPGSLGVTPAALTITADNKSRAFGVANPPLTATFTGLVNSDTSAVVTGLALATNAILTSPAGNYPITAGGATAQNYAITFVNGVLAVAQSQNLLTITADNLSKIYGAALPAFTATYAGLLNGDTSAVVTGLQFSTTATVGSNVGTYAITPFGGSATSYTLAYVPGLLTINPAALTITANSASRTYGATNPVFGASFTGLVNGDTSAVVTGLAITTAATASSNVGSYAITPSSGTASNYTLSYAPGALAVTPAPLAVTADAASKTYGAANPAFRATFSGFVNGDNASAVSGLTFTTPASTVSGVGAYAIVPGSAVAANYALTFIPGTLTVNRASLTITAVNASREFGASNPAFSATFGGLVNGDTPAVVSGLSFTTPATSTSPIGDYIISPVAAVAANYAFVFVNGTLQVVTPAVTAGTTPLPVTTINQQPVITSELAVVVQGGRLVLLPVDTQGTVSNATSSPSVSLDGKLAAELSEVTRLPRLASATNAPGTPSGRTLSSPNLGGFQLVTSLGGGARGSAMGGATGLTVAQMNEPGLFREASVNMGRYNIIYHEALADAHQQTESNTALGSSYREFLDTEQPRMNIVRAATGGDPGNGPAKPAAGRIGEGAQ